MPEPPLVWKPMAQKEPAEPEKNDGPGAGPCPAEGTSEMEALRAKIAFLEKKLNIVGSVTRHDVLNQLTAIVGYTELMGMMVEDTNLKSFLDKETQAVNKIRRQFQFAKDYQNIAAEPPRWQNLTNTLHRVREHVDLKEVTITAETGDMAVYADPLFEKVFIHLFENTILHGSMATGIRISLQPDEEFQLVMVEDNGAGIPAEDKERIFDRGYGKGTGWGLFLARDILAATGATLLENGDPGKGARFVIRLPPGSFRSGGGE